MIDSPFLSSIDHQFLPIKPIRQRIELHNPDDIYIIKGGSIDLYAVENVDNQPIGAHLFIGEFNKGQWVFNFPSKEETQFTLIASIKGKSEIIKVSRRAIIQKNHEFNPLLSAKIHEWCRSLLNIFTKQNNNEKDRILESPGTYALDEHEKFTLGFGRDHEPLLLWIELEKGSMTDALNCYAFSSGDLFPILSKQIYIAISLSEIRLLSTDELLKKEWPIFLDRFHLFFLKAFSKNELENQRHRSLLIQKQENEEQTILQNSLGDLVKVLNEENVAIIEKAPSIVTACKKLGTLLDVNFIFPDVLSNDIRQQVADISQISNIRVRSLYLPEGWWKEDSGSMLAVYQQNDQLIPVATFLKNGHYVFMHPENGQEIEINSTNGFLFSQTAFAFYQSFPSHSLKLRDLLHFGVKAQRRTVWMLIFVALGVVLLNAFTPIASKLIFGTIIPDLNTTLLWQVGSGLFIAAISSTIFIFTRGYLMLRINSIIGIKLECAKWDRLLNFPVNFFNKFTVGELATRLFGLTRIRQLFNESFLSLLITAVFSVLYLILMFIYSFHLTLSVLGVVVIVFLISLVCLRVNYKIQQWVTTKRGELSGFLLQAITGVAKLKTMAAEKKAFAYWGNEFAKIKTQDIRGQNILTILNTVIAMLPTTIYLTIFVFMTSWIVDSINSPINSVGQMNFGDFFGFVAAYGAFSSAIFALMPALTQNLGRIRPTWNWAKIIFETEPVLDQIKKNPGKLTGQLSLDRISFRYDKEGSFILKDISLRANPGEFIAIVGPSGCGKSTLLRILLGFDSPETGSVYYDYQDLSNLNLREVRKQLGVVLQSGAIIAGSIYENIACGSLYTPVEVMDALKLAAFDKDMPNFPMGIYTMLPSGGTTITGGQRQRLLIARALVGKPKILLFDEATSALDNASQEIITQNIDALNVTRVVIAHRLSTIKNADRIYVIDQGVVVQEGTFEELAKEPGLFKYLVERQKV